MGNNIQNILDMPSKGIIDDGDEELLLFMSEREANPEDARLAWEEFYRRHAKYVLYICRKVLRDIFDENMINGVLMETFMKVYLSAHTYQLGNEQETEKVRHRVRAWLGVIARNVAFDTIRGKNDPEAIQIEPEDWDQLGGAQENTISKDTKIVRDLMDRILDERERAILQATYLYYNPNKENQRLPNNVANELCEYFATTPANLRRIRKNATEKIEEVLIAHGYKNHK